MEEVEEEEEEGKEGRLRDRVAVAAAAVEVVVVAVVVVEGLLFGPGSVGSAVWGFRWAVVVLTTLGRPRGRTGFGSSEPCVGGGSRTEEEEAGAGLEEPRSEFTALVTLSQLSSVFLGDSLPALAALEEATLVGAFFFAIFFRSAASKSSTVRGLPSLRIDSDIHTASSFVGSNVFFGAAAAAAAASPSANSSSLLSASPSRA